MAKERDLRVVPRWPLAASGVIAAAAFLGVASLISALFSPMASPAIALGDAVVDATPGWLKDFAIATFGIADKLVLFVVMGVVAAVLAAVLGLLARRHLLLVVVLGVVIAGLLSAVVLTRPNTGWPDVLPTVVGAAAGLLVLRWLIGLAQRLVPSVATASSAESDQPDGRDGSELSRRTFLLAAGVTAVVAVVAAGGGRALSAAGRATAAAREALRLPKARRPAAPLPAGVAAKAPGMPDFVTANGDFYRIDTALALPRIDPAEWQLRVHGMVENEVVLSFDELLDKDLQESWVTLTCVSNPVGGELIGNAKWLGYPIRELLRQARPLPDADMVLSTSADGFTASTPLTALTDDRDAILAVGMNDEPLPIAHGFPVRMVVPGLYGYVSATKWVVDLEVTRFADAVAYWTERGWSQRGPIKLASRIDVPRGTVPLPAGEVVFGGTAWAQGVGIDRVQVQIDDGAWSDATLAAEASVDTWRQWSYTWSGRSGEHVARVRAISRDGEVQTGQRASPVPNGATGWHEVRFEVA